MKSVKPIYFLVFLSCIKCQTLQRRLLDAAIQHNATQNYLQENLRDITSIMVAQFLQKATYEEVQTIAKELLGLSEKCKSLESRESLSPCAHQLMTTFLEYICNNPGMLDNHGSSHCCNTSNTARHKCFLSYKKDDAEYSDIFQIPNAEHICEMDKENHVSVKDRYSFEISRTYPFLYGPTILTMSACCETAVQSCCQEENKTKCLQIKLEPIRKYVKEMSLRHHHLCEIKTKFNHTVAKAMELVLLTKKQPKANFSEIAKLTMDVKNLHEICCEGNTVACALGRSQLMNYTCSKQAILSSKITQCCEQPVPFREECIIISENDDKPDLLPLPLSRFTEDQFVCEEFTDKQEDFLQEFLYEYSRRNPELAVPVILRVNTVYENLLGNCCKLENPLECYSYGLSTLSEPHYLGLHENHFDDNIFQKHGCLKLTKHTYNCGLSDLHHSLNEMFQKVVRESSDHVKNHCDLLKKLGESSFHDRLIVLYTKKAPQLSAQEVVLFTKKMAAAATRCCLLSGVQQFLCVEDSAKLILGALCRRHVAEPINAAVGHCCDDSYAFRKPCFDDLQIDRTYVAPSLSCHQIIRLKEDLCGAQEEELHIEKQKFLSNLVKQKLYASETQFQAILGNFTHLVQVCCRTEKSEICFQEEGSKLIEECQSVLEA